MLTLADEATGKSWVFLCKTRDEVHNKIKQWKAYVEVQSGEKLAIMRCDNAKEFIKLEQELQWNGMHFEYIVPYCKESNGIAERLNRTVGCKKSLHHPPLPALPAKVYYPNREVFTLLSKYCLKVK